MSAVKVDNSVDVLNEMYEKSISMIHENILLNSNV